MPIERASASEQIADALRAQIETGELAAGGAFPPDAELARRFGVSKPTASKARAMLVALGLVTSRAGAASTVREPSREAPPPAPEPQRVHRTRRSYPEGSHTTVLSARLVPAPADVAGLLGAEPGSSVIQRRRITHSADQAALATSTTYFPAGLAGECPALLQTRRIRQGTTRYIEEQTGRSAGSIAVTLACAPADRKDSDALYLPAGSYVLALSTTTYDAAGAALAHEVELHPPDTPIALDVMTA